MPTTYAHYRFGRNVYQQLPCGIQDIIRSHGGLYNIGLHGPDLFFYYQVFRKNPVNQTGFDMHPRPGMEFFEEAALRIRRCPGRSPRLPSFLASSEYAYVFGFLCHFALDSSCHPYVEQMVRQTGISHSEIEAELDRDLMIRDGFNPMTFCPTRHLKPLVFYGHVIARFFPHLRARQVLASIRSMRFCCAMLAPRGRKLRLVTRYLMKSGRLPVVVQDMMIKEDPNPACVPITRELERLYEQAVSLAAELIVNFMEHMQTGVPLDIRLNHTFGED